MNHCLPADAHRPSRVGVAGVARDHRAIVSAWLQPCAWVEDPGVALWRVDLDAPVEPHAQALLTAQERDRAERFAFDSDRRRYLASHAALRGVLSARIGRDRASRRFGIGAFGKPSGQGGDHPWFNLSHSGPVGLIGLSEQVEIGVDVEVVRPVEDAHRLALDLYTPAERDEIGEAAARGCGDPAFLTVWVRKEACLKACGDGLQIAPASFEAGATHDTRHVHLTSARGDVEVQVHSHLDPRGVVMAYATCESWRGERSA